jgi:hypothetical protein
MPEFSFDNQRFHRILTKAGLNFFGIKGQAMQAIIFLAVCWLPLAAYALLHGSFWTGNIKTSFITHFDTQARLLIALPLLILCESRVRAQLSKIFVQFSESEIIAKAEEQRYRYIVEHNMRFLRSGWTDIALLLLCYLQVFLVFSYETTDFSSLFSWQTAEQQGVRSLNFAGRWNEFVSRPLMLFIMYRWLLRTIVWGNIMRKISNLNLNLYPLHPDQLGGLGFLGFTLGFFSPVAFAISAVVAGHFADFILLANMHLADLKFIFIVYLVFITLLFSLPLIAFTKALGNARENAIFKYYDLTAGMHRELVKRISEKGYKVEQQDLDTQHYSAVCDFNGLIVNALQMKSLPFSLKDLLPLWIATIIPFVPVILIEIPFVEILKTLSGLLM